MLHLCQISKDLNSFTVCYCFHKSVNTYCDETFTGWINDIFLINQRVEMNIPLPMLNSPVNKKEKEKTKCINHTKQSKHNVIYKLKLSQVGCCVSWFKESKPSRRSTLANKIDIKQVVVSMTDHKDCFFMVLDDKKKDSKHQEKTVSGISTSKRWWQNSLMTNHPLYDPSINLGRFVVQAV